MSEFYSAGRHVPAGSGWQWIKDGWTLFTRAPALWIGITLLWAVIAVAIGLVPIIGTLAGTVLGPVFAAGLLLGCRALDEGSELKVEHLFAGFRERFGVLAAVGLVYLAAAILVTLVTALAVGFKLYALLSAGPADAEGIIELLLLGALAVLIWVALMLPVVMAVWFAPCLVVFRHMSAMQAIRASFAGCLKNVVPFLVYGLVLLIPAIVATIPFALGWLVLAPLVITSLYTSYKDIYSS
jgi:uncharacterized membrane protein